MAPALTRAEVEAWQLANRYARDIKRVYAEAERTLFEKITKRLAKGLSLDAATWEAQRQGDVSGLMREARAIVQAVQAEDPAVAKAVETAYRAGMKEAVASLTAAHIADIAAPAPFRTGHALEQLTKLLLDSTRATHTRMLRVTDDVYRNVIAQAAQQATAGAISLTDAAQLALNRFADKGITGFVDSVGRNWGLQEYVDMATRTTTANASREGHIDQMQANGFDLVKISRHGNCCPLCAPWEGKVLSLSGKSEKYPALEEARAAGLFHPNCGHRTLLWTPDMPADDDGQPEYDPQAYAAEQKQRAYERGIRQWKKREAVALTPEGKRQAAAKVKEWQGKQREWIANSGHDLRRNYSRESIAHAL